MSSRHSPSLKAKGARAPDTRSATRRGTRHGARTSTRPRRLHYIYEEDEDSFDVPDTVLGSGEK